MWEAVFDFGPPSPVDRARPAAPATAPSGGSPTSRPASARWPSPATSSGYTSTEIYSQGRDSDLIALGRATGDRAESRPLRRQHVRLERRRVRRRQGGPAPGRQLRRHHAGHDAGASGWPALARPSRHRCCRWAHRVGAPTRSLSATGTAPLTWTIQSGALPDRARLSADRRPQRHAPTGAHDPGSSSRSRAATGVLRPGPCLWVVVASAHPGVDHLIPGRDAEPARARDRSASTSTTRPPSRSAGRRHRPDRPVR